jgi:hypothetical protein
MNKRQRNIITNAIFVIALTIAAVIAMIQLRDWVNRSEALRAMEHLSRVVQEYKEEHGFIPPESYINQIKEDLEGSPRVGDLKYRARWIDFESGPDTILAYFFQPTDSLLFEDVYIVLRSDGRIEQIPKQPFEELLSQQQSQIEKEQLLP